jgi:hypothetical protein
MLRLTKKYLTMEISMFLKMLPRSLRSRISPRFQLSTRLSPNKKRASGKSFKDTESSNQMMNVRLKSCVTPMTSQSTVILFTSLSTMVLILKSNLKQEEKDPHFSVSKF